MEFEYKKKEISHQSFSELLKQNSHENSSAHTLPLLQVILSYNMYLYIFYYTKHITNNYDRY